MASQSGHALFLQERVARTLSTCECAMVPTSAPPPPPEPHQSQPDQTPRSTECNAPCQLKTNIFSHWVSSARRRPGFNFQNQEAHTLGLDLVFTTPSTLRAADAFTKSLLVTTPSKPHHLPHDNVEAVHCCTMHYHADASRTRQQHDGVSGGITSPF